MRLSLEINDAGFSGDWSIPLLNRSYPQAWIAGRAVDVHEIEAGVRLFEPVALYDRSGLRRALNGVRATRILPSQLRDMERMLPHRLPLRGTRQQIPDVTLASFDLFPDFRVVYRP